MLDSYVVSTHLARQAPWKEWLQRIVKIPSTDSSIRSRQTVQMGNSVKPDPGEINPLEKSISSSPQISTRAIYTKWQTSVSIELYGVPLNVL